MFKRCFLFLVLLWGALEMSSGFALASSEADTVIGECQKRTGMGRESCISFIKKYMNVERCQQYAKLSAEQCEQKLEEIRKSPEFREGSGSSTPATPQKTDPQVPRSVKPLEGTATLTERIKLVRQDKAARFQLVEEELERILRFLRERGVDVAHLENRLTVFREKRDIVLRAYDQYESVASAPAETRPSLAEPKRIVSQLLNDAAAYYRNDLLPDFKKSVDTVQE